MTPIRLLFVLTSPVRGGVEEVVLALLRRLDPGEFRLAVAAPRPLLDAFAPDLRGVRVDTGETADGPGGIARLSRFMGRVRPDVVNAHLFRAVAVAAPLARLHRVRGVVETYHGREGWRRGPVRGSFAPDRAVARLVDRVIAVSEAARDFLVTGKGYPARKIVVIPNGRDLAAFTPGAHRETVRKELGVGGETPVVAVVGRLDAQKGHTHLLRAWPAVRAEFPDARLVLVGDGVLRDVLAGEARALGVADAVTFTGFRADVPRLLDAADVVALPSLYEGMPLTVIEASAMARPIVATRVDGTPEVVVDGETGCLVPPADPAALARAISALLGDPARARALGEAARARARVRFDLARQVEATAGVYRDVVR